MIDEITIETGSLSDYRALAHFHYRAGRPATAVRTYRAVDRWPTVVGRFLRRSEEREILGALVVSMPHLSCAMRNHALGGRYRGLRRSESARLLNAEMRTISRVVVDPRCRGMGLAIAMVRHALERADTPYTESLAAMGRVHPFFERAGMMRFDPPIDHDAERLLAAMAMIGLDARDFLVPGRIESRLAHVCSTEEHAWIEDELRRIARPGRVRAAGRAAPPALRDVIAAARARLLCRPVYYLHASDSPVSTTNISTSTTAINHEH